MVTVTRRDQEIKLENKRRTSLRERKAKERNRARERQVEKDEDGYRIDRDALMDETIGNACCKNCRARRGYRGEAAHEKQTRCA